MKKSITNITRKFIAFLLSGLMIWSQTGMDVFANPDAGNEGEQTNLIDRNVNPEINIQHYLYFSAVSLGMISGDKDSNDKIANYSSVTYNPRDKNDWADSPWESSETPKTDTGTALPIYNTERRGGIPENGDAIPQYGVVLNDVTNTDYGGTFSSHVRLKQLFLDEKVNYLEKPQLPYMNRLYNSNTSANPNYVLKEIWVSKPGQGENGAWSNPSTQDKNQFYVQEVPLKDGKNKIVGHLMDKNDEGKIVNREVYARDPSRVTFTNNPDYQKNGQSLEKDEQGNAIPTYFGEDASKQLVIPVTDKTIIRFAFEPTDGSLDSDDSSNVSAINFFDYDISDGNIYLSENDAKTGSNPQNTSSKTNGKTVWMRTASSDSDEPAGMGINLNANYDSKKTNTIPKLAFGNVNTGTGLGNQAGLRGKSGVAPNDKEQTSLNYINRFNLNNAAPNIPISGLGAVFGLAKGLSSEGNLIWNDQINAPDLFTAGNNITGKTDYVDSYSLGFKRSGGTYVLEKVNKKEPSGKTEVTGNLSKIKPDESNVFTNNFWPMDSAESFGTDGHDMTFGQGKLNNNGVGFTGISSNKFCGKTSNKSDNVANPADRTHNNEKDGSADDAALPPSDNGKDHNSYFGMNFTVDFYLDPGYAGPLRYYFYGDDDLFVFLSEVNSKGNIIPDTSELIADVGGVHSSVGMYVNLWDTIGKPIPYKNDEGEDNSTKRYRLSFFYTERGASGSTCYMRFTVPFQSLKTRQMEYTGVVQIEKEVKTASDEDKEKDYNFKLELKYPNLSSNGQAATLKQFDDCAPLVNRYKYEIWQKGEGDIEDSLIEKSANTQKYIAHESTFTLKHGQYIKIFGLPGKAVDVTGTEEKDDSGIVATPATYYRVTELPSETNPTTTFASGKVTNDGSAKLHTDFKLDKKTEGQTAEYNYVKFINAINPGTLRLTKKIAENPSAPADQKYAFSIKLTNSDGTPITTVSSMVNTVEQPDMVNENGVFEAELNKDDTWIFYNLPKGTQYEIVETADDQFVVDSIETTGNGSEAKYNFADRSVSGKLSVDDQPDTTVIYTNKYQPNLPVSFEITKKISGRPAIDGGEIFTFELTDVTEDPRKKLLESPVLQNVLVKAGEQESVFNFGPFNFTEDGDYTFQIREVKPGNAETDLAYDSTVYQAKVNIKNVQNRLVLENGSPSYSKIVNGEEGPAIKTVSFVNVYSPETDLPISFVKTIDGTPNTGDKYTFEISAKDDAPLPVEGNRQIVLTADGSSNSLTGNFNIHYDKKDDGQTYTYTVKETAATDKDKEPIANLDCDRSEYEIKVKVSLDKTSGTDVLKANIESVTKKVDGEEDLAVSKEEISFRNVYKSTQVEIPFAKILNGRELNDQDRFEFVLTNVTNESEPKDIETIILSNADKSDSNSRALNGKFSPLVFTETGNHTYEIAETNLNVNNVGYDTTKYRVAINVTEDQKKAPQLATPNVTYTKLVEGKNGEDVTSTGIIFTNTSYTPVTWNPEVTKNMIGGSAEGFTFEMEIESKEGSSLDNVIRPESLKAVSDADGRVQFDAITFTQPGAYTVTINENTPETDDMIHYDRSRVVYHVSVADKKDSAGTLVVTHSLEEGQSAVFKNDAGLLVRKELVAGSGVELTDKDYAHLFTFKLTQLESADGINISVNAVYYDLNGNKTEEFDLTEGDKFTLAPNQTVRLYGLPVGAKYTIEEQSEEGYLLTNATGNTGDIASGQEQAAVFRNVKLGIDTGELKGYKTLTNTEGSNKKLEQGMFKFKIEPFRAVVKNRQDLVTESTEPVLSDPENGAEDEQDFTDNGAEGENAQSGWMETTPDRSPDGTAAFVDTTTKTPVFTEETNLSSDAMPKLEQLIVSNDENGEFSFGSIEFDRPGTYVYKVSEVIDSKDVSHDSEVTYDSTVFYATFVVEEVKDADGHTIGVEANSPVLTKNLPYGTGDQETQKTEGQIHFTNDFVGKPDLAIEKWQSLNNEEKTKKVLTAEAGDTVTYFLVVSVPPEATAPARDVKVSDFIPFAKEGIEGDDEKPELTLIQGSQGDGEYNPATGEIKWSLGMMTPGSRKTVSFTVKVPSVTQPTSWTNVANATYSNNPKNPDNPDDPQKIQSNDVTVETDPVDPKVEIKKKQALNNDVNFTAEPPLPVEKDDVVTYQLYITNTGEALAKNVVVTDTVPEGLTLIKESISHNGKVDDEGTITWNLGDLAANATTTVTFRVIVPEIEESGQSWKNIGYVKYDNPPKDHQPEDPDKGDPSNEVEIIGDVPVIDIHKHQRSVTKNTEYAEDLNTQDPPMEVDIAEEVEYRLTITNTSTVTAENVVVTDKVPEGLIYKDNSVSTGGHYQDGMLTWSWDELAAGATKEVTFSVLVPKVDRYTHWKNIGHVSFTNNPENDPDKPDEPKLIPSEEVEIHTNVPNLRIEKLQSLDNGATQTKNGLHANAGDTVIYYLKVTSDGNETAQNVSVSDTIPEGLTLVKGSISDGGTLKGKTITWNLGDMNPENETRTKTVSFKVTIPEQITQPQRWTNVAVATYPNNPDPDPEIPSNEVDVDVNTPALSIEKLQRLSDQGEFQKEIMAVHSGDTVVYKLVVRNTGKSEAKDVVITDTVPEGLIYVADSASDNGSFNISSNTVTWAIGNLAAGESVERTFNVQVPQTEGTRTWVNIGYTSYSNNPDNPEDPDEPNTPIPSNDVEIYTPTENGPHVIIRKHQQLNDGMATTLPLTGQAGDMVTYSLTITNTSDQDATNLVIKDEIPAGLKFVEGSITENGQLVGRRITWTLATLAPGESYTVSFKAVLPKVSQNTSWKNVGVLTYGNNPEEPDEETPSNEVEIDTNLPELTLEKLQSVDNKDFTKDLLTVKDGNVVTYKLIVKNIGKVTANKVVISDPIPEGLSYVENSASDNGVYADGKVTWVIGNLNAGESREVTFQCVVPKTEKATTWKNVGSVVYENNPNGPDSETPSNEVVITNLNCPECPKCPDGTVCPPPTRPDNTTNNNTTTTPGTNVPGTNTNTSTRNPSVNVPDTGSSTTGTTTNNTTTTSNPTATKAKTGTNTAVNTQLMTWVLVAAGGLAGTVGFLALDRKKQKKKD